MACGSHAGTVTLLELSEGLSNIQRNEKSSVNAVSKAEGFFLKENSKNSDHNISVHCMILILLTS